MAPPWVADALGQGAREGEPSEKEGVLVKTRRSRDLLWIRALVPGAAKLDDRAFQSAVAHCYVMTLEVIHGAELHPLRVWNFVPEIRRPSDDGYSRYELFNAGRQQGHEAVDPTDPSSYPITASCVGHPGDDLVVQMLAGRVEAVPVENPRQCPSYHYSARYGPQPPLFSRASRLCERLGELPWQHQGLVSGTASIVGEDSTHEGDLRGQLDETLLNLATVAGEVIGRPLEDPPSPTALSEALAVYRELRVYVVRESDVPEIRDAISAAFPGIRRLELVSAQLCRPELLVETEGILHWEG